MTISPVCVLIGEKQQLLLKDFLKDNRSFCFFENHSDPIKFVRDYFFLIRSDRDYVKVHPLETIANIVGMPNNRKESGSYFDSLKFFGGFLLQ